MIRKPVLGLAGAFLAGLTLTGCQSTNTNKPFTPPNSGVSSGVRPMANNTPSSSTNLAGTNSISGTSSVNPTGGMGGGTPNYYGATNAGTPYTNNSPGIPAAGAGAGVSRSNSSALPQNMNATGSAPAPTGGSVNFTPIDPTPINPPGRPASITPLPTTGSPVLPPTPPAPMSNTTTYPAVSDLGPATGPVGGPVGPLSSGPSGMGMAPGAMPLPTMQMAPANNPAIMTPSR